MRIVLLIVLLSASALTGQAQQRILNLYGTTGIVRNEGFIRVAGAVGGGDDGGLYLTGAAYINNGGTPADTGTIRISGWFTSERTAGGNATGTPGSNAFALPRPNGTLIMDGQSGPHIAGTQETRFNNLTLENQTIVTQDLDAYIDAASALRLRQSSELSTSIHRMIVENNAPTAVVAEDEDCFVSSEADNSSPNAESADERPWTYGGRLAWYTQNNANETYLFPVGHRSLSPFRRDVIIRPQTTGLRKYMVRLVAKDPEVDQWTLLFLDPEQNICALNERFYHIVDDSTAIRADGTEEYPPTREDFAVTQLAIEYGPNDPVNDLIQYERDLAQPEMGNWLAMGADLGFTYNGKTFGSVPNWRRFDFPVFAWGLKNPLDGISTDPAYLPPRFVFNNRQNDPRGSATFNDNPDNDPRYQYNWQIRDNRTGRIVGRFSTRNPTVDFSKDYLDSTVSPPMRRMFPPGTYTMEMVISNPLNPQKCNAVDELSFIVKPSLVYYVPDAFSPNGQGANENFIGWFYGFERLKFVVYNRWGDVISVRIVDKQDPQVPAPNPDLEGPGPGEYIPPGNEPPYANGGVLLWNGKDKNNNICPEGVYVYTIEVESSIADTPDKVWRSNGTITLIR